MADVEGGQRQPGGLDPKRWRSEETWRSLIEGADDIIMIVDAESTLEYVNHTVPGISRDEVIGRPLFDFAPAEHHELMRETLAKVYATGEPQRYEITGLGPHGSVAWYTTQLSPIMVGDQVSAVALITRDITDRKQTEEALRESERNLEQAQAIARIGHWKLDPKTEQVTASGELLRIFGLSRHDTSLDRFVEVVHPDDVEYDLYHIRQGMEHGVPWNIEHRLLLKDGTEKTINALGRAMVDENGQVQMLMGTVQDITGRKQAEQERRELESKLQQAHKMESLGTLAGGVAHDMNNVLSMIMLSASLLKRTSPEENIRDVDDILDACRRGKDLTENLLGFARKGSFAKEPYNVAEVVSETVSLLQKTIYKGIAIELAQDPNLPQANGDRSRLAQALMNVCLNAVDAMAGRGTLTLAADQLGLAEADNEHDLKAGGYVRIRVSDTGAGMTEDILAQCLDPFFTTKTKGKGTGLGLSMAYSIARDHDGNLTIESQPEQGTTVTFWLPVAERLTSKQTGCSEPQAPVTGATVLLVDDEKQIRITSRKVLERLGYEVLTADNGKSALETYQHHQDKIDVVILDLIMPVMDGADCFIELRRQDPTLKILFSSGYAEDDRKIELLLSMGASGCVKKPYTLEELNAKLSQVLND